MISGKIYNDVYQGSIDFPPYFTGLSVFFGYLTFDLKGIIYGPLFFCIAYIIISFTS